MTKEKKEQLTINDLQKIVELLHPPGRMARKLYINSNTKRAIEKDIPATRITDAKLFGFKQLHGLDIMIDDSFPDGFIENDLQRAERQERMLNDLKPPNKTKE